MAYTKIVIIPKFGSFGAGPELADLVLAEYRLRHNMNVGTLDRYGYAYKGHYESWLVQNIDNLRRLPQVSQSCNMHIAIDVNATMNYKGSSEVFGICPLPDAEMSRLKIKA